MKTLFQTFTALRRSVPLSLRLQLAAWYTMAFAVLHLLTGAVFYQYLETSLEASVDTDLQIRAQQMADGLVSHHGTLTLSGVAAMLLPVPPVRDEVQYLAVTLNSMLDSLDQSFSRQRRFVVDASHELRTPVTVIRNKTEVALLRPRSQEDYCRVLHSIHVEAERLSHLISDLLALARGDEGQARLECEPVRLDQLVESVAANADGLAQERGIHLSVQPLQPVTLIGDEARLMQVVMNLLDNAIRYTEPLGSVQVSLLSTSSEARLIVQDTGIGIAPEHLPHIFERFYRADPSRPRTGGSGTGLRGSGRGTFDIEQYGEQVDEVYSGGSKKCLNAVYFFPYVPGANLKHSPICPS